MRLGSLVLVAALALVGCGPTPEDATAPTDPVSAGSDVDHGATAEGSEVTITATEFSFDDVPATVPAGDVTFRLRNDGAMSHNAQLFQIPASSEERYLDDSTFEAAMQGATSIGGPGSVEPLTTSNPVTVTLQPGTYAFHCWFTTDGRGHGSRGMRATFTVEGDRVDVAEPTVDGTIELDEMTFEVPDTFDGAGTWRVENAGSTYHELVVLELGPGATTEDARAMLARWDVDVVPAPDELVFRGGVMALRARKAARAGFDLAPGTYAFACFVPSGSGTDGGRRHVDEGMLEVVEVT